MYFTILQVPIRAKQICMRVVLCKRLGIYKFATRNPCTEDLIELQLKDELPRLTLYISMCICADQLYTAPFPSFQQLACDT
jgi:hypothetical protein